MTEQLVMVGIAAGAIAVSAQTPAPKPPPEAATIAVGWAALANGDARRGSEIGAAALQQFPRNPAALSLYVQAEVARGGSAAGLAAYERWLGTKRLENAYVLRHVALGVLREAAANDSAANLRREAYMALADEGDAPAMDDIRRNAAANGLVENQILGKLGDEAAIRRLIATLKTTPGTREQLITALAATRSPLVVPPLIQLLSDRNDITRAAAADALGVLGATQAVAQIRPLLGENEMPYVRMTAAGALYRLNDASGLAFLRQMQNSEHPQVRLDALRTMSQDPDPSWQSAVRALAHDPDANIRRQAAELIAPYDLETARAVLEELNSDGNLAIREEAARIFVEKVATDLTALRRYLHGPDGLIKARSANRILALTR